MTSTLAGPAEVDEPTPHEARAELTGLDLLAGGALLVVALWGWAALVLAHLGAHSAPAVVALTLSGVVVLGLLAARSGRVRVRADWPGVGVALLCAAAAAALTFPGFSYGVSDKDPGGYVAHAASISRTGDYAFVDPLLASGAPVQLISPGARFPGVWVRGDKEADGSCGPDRDGCKIVPQFYHLWPALLATSFDVGEQLGVGGHSALFATVPLPAVLSVLLLVAVLRRVGDALLSATTAATGSRAPPGLAGLAAGLAGGLLLATNMLQVWQSRFPTTEVLAQSLYLGALLGIVVALQTGWRPAAGFAGLCVGIGWLNRADGVLLVVMLVGVGALLLAVRRWDGRAWWGLAGLGVVLPHALRQAYDLALFYSQANDVPSLEVLTTVCLVLLGLGAGVGAVEGVLARRGSGLVALARARRAQVVLGLVCVAVAAGLLALGYLRPRLFGEARFDYLGRDVRSFDEQIMQRLTWFFTLPGFALMLAGVAVVALRRWKAAVWAVVLPTLVLFPLYAYSARNSTRLLWWTRRYVPTVMPGVLLLIALAIAFAVVWRYQGRAVLRVPGLLALAGLVAVFLSQSLPLRAHDEWSGSVEVAQRVAATSPGETGLYLWEPNQGCCTGPTQLFATPVWLSEGEVSTLLPTVVEQRAGVIADYRQRFPDMPLFVVADKGQLPEGVDAAAVTPVEDFGYTLPMWEENDFERPDEPRTVQGRVSVWRVTGT